MAQPWTVLSTVDTDEGPLELRRRGQSDYLITIDGRVLMSSHANRSELALSELACAAVKGTSPRVLIGGLGMGYTVKAAIDALPATAKVLVAELNPVVVDWCRGELAELTDDALGDPRVKVEVTDVAEVIAGAGMPGASGFDAIILDLYEGPHEATQDANDPFYGRSALQRTATALRPKGVFAIWSEEPDGAFESRLSKAGFQWQKHRRGRGRGHTVYVATR